MRLLFGKYRVIFVHYLLLACGRVLFCNYASLFDFVLLHGLICMLKTQTCIVADLFAKAVGVCKVFCAWSFFSHGLFRQKYDACNNATGDNGALHPKAHVETVRVDAERVSSNECHDGDEHRRQK